MNFFGKNKKENWIIKLFKITDKISAENFDTEDCIISTINAISLNSKLKATYFGLNYQNSRKTLSGFKKALKKQKEIVYSSVYFGSDKSNTHFTISNPMLNYTEQPDNSKVDICIQIADEFIEKEAVEDITEKLIENYDFEYGYITKLPENYDSYTERKIQRGLFSTTIKSNESDGIWTFHSVGILNGFIKRLYSVNYLNKSHFLNLPINDIILENGYRKRVTEDITKWTLNSKELERLKQNKEVEKISIITPGLGFLKTEKAIEFKDKMRLKKPVANNGYN